MPKKLYDDSTRAAIIEAVSIARKAEKTWMEAFEAAQGAGYKGSVQGIQKLMKDAGVPGIFTRKMRRKAAKKAPAPKAAKNAPAPATGLDSIQQIVDNLVKERVQAIIERAIAELKKLAD